MKLLLIAPTADREAVGEAELAYQWVSRLASRHDVTVLTYYQRAGRRLADQLPDVRVVDWAEPPILGRYERFNAMLNPGYIPFRHRARRWIRDAQRRGERFDLAHQVAPVSVRYPSPVTDTGIPYVLGPVGGSLSSPPAFAEEEGGAPWFTGLRAVDGLRLRFDPVLRRSFAQAGAVIGIADYVRDVLAGVPIRDFRTMSDVGIDTLPEPVPPSRRTERVRFLFVGRVVRTKGVRDGIRALAQLPRGSAIYDVVGDGYDREECEALVNSLGLQDDVHFHGRVPHEAVERFYRNADVFLFPSYREAGGIVVVEALSYGLPSIVCAAGGPAAAVEQTCGIRVEARDPEQYANDLAAAMAELVADPGRRARLGRSAGARAATFYVWDRRIEAMEMIYSDVLAAALVRGSSNPAQPK